MHKYLSIVLLICTVNFLAAATTSVENNPPTKKKQFVVMIDAGHGGRDTGTPGTGRYKTTEKDIALDVSLALVKC